MSNDHDYLRTGENPSFRLRAEVLALMLKGAGYAALFCLVVWFLIVMTIWLGKLLPPESKEAQDPTPFSYVLPVDPAVYG